MVKALNGQPVGRINMRGEARDIRADHVARYEWAAERTEGHVIDAGCNCGYGSAILADAGLTVTALDMWFLGLQYARQHWDRSGITWERADFTEAFEFPPANAVAAFEIVEHLADPRPLLIEAHLVAGRLFASVPNEDVWPHEPRLWPVHQRHYTREQFEALLTECGWTQIEWWGQADGWSPVEPDVRGRTLVVECR